MAEIEVLAIIGIAIAVGLFLLGFRIAKQSDEKMLKNMVKALNINRELGEGTEGDPKLFIDKGTVKGSRTVSFSVEFTGSVIDFEKKKKYTKEGVIELTDADIAKLRLLPQFRKTSI